jgi:hypothetical protein
MEIVKEREKYTLDIAPKLIRCTLDWEQDNYPKHIPKYNSKGVVTNKKDLRVWAQVGEGHFFLVRRPRKTHFNRYAIGADVATGVAGGEGDYCVAYVIDRLNMEWVMQYRGILNTKRYAEILAQLGYYYHNAGILVERNGPGEGVIANLLDIYPNQHVLRGLRMLNGDLVPDDKYGWHEGQSTTSSGIVRGSKIKLVDTLYEFIDSTPEKIPFAAFWTDARTFMQDDQGRLGADGKRLDPGRKNYDDCVMAGGLTLMADELMQVPVKMRPDDEIEGQRSKAPVRTYIEEGVLV